MKDLSEIKKQIGEMSRIAFSMWQGTYRTFMEHDTDLVVGILEQENKLNDLEKEITIELVELSRNASGAKAKEELGVYTDVTADLELIGDYCKDILERVQIKIEENLMFSDEAVKEYTELYQKTASALEEVAFSLEKDNPAAVGTVLKHQEHIDRLVDEYRHRHNQRLVEGKCSPMACNMFLNMLDFTAAVYYHAKKIARNLLKLKR